MTKVLLSASSDLIHTSLTAYDFKYHGAVSHMNSTKILSQMKRNLAEKS